MEKKRRKYERQADRLLRPQLRAGASVTTGHSNERRSIRSRNAPASG